MQYIVFNVECLQTVEAPRQWTDRGKHMKTHEGGKKSISLTEFVFISNCNPQSLRMFHFYSFKKLKSKVRHSV